MACVRFAASMLLVVSALGLSPSDALAASYGAPAGWRNIPDFPIYTDQASGFTQSASGLESVSGHLPVDTTQSYGGYPSLKFHVSQDGTTWLSSMQVIDGWASHDISGYLPDGYIEFNVKGLTGGEQFKVGAIDHFGQRRPVEIESKVLVSNYATITTDWQHVRVPLKDIFTQSSGINAYGTKAISVDIAKGTIWLNQIKLTTTDKERGYPAIKINQVGYPNQAAKIAKVSGFEDEFTATVGTPFQVRRKSDDSVAYAGTLALVKDYDSESGERVLKADFSDLKDSGTYYLTVSASGIDKSLDFQIGSSLFKPLLADASKYYFYQRSGIEITSQYSDFPRVDPEPHDNVSVLESNHSVIKEESKGWFDAGDKGKWMASGTSAASTLLWSYEMFPEAYSDRSNIPESGNGVPDVLDEARWELEWILKMQDTDGGLYGKLDNLDDNTRCVRDIYNGVGNIKPTNDTGSAVTCLAHASIVYATIDPAFAAKCLDAAKLGWGYLVAHPNNIKGPGYTADSDTDSRFSAAAALYRATGETKYSDFVVAHHTTYSGLFTNKYSDWVGSPLYAFVHYAKSAKPDADTMAWFRTEFAIYRKDRMERCNGNAWGNAISNGNYYWGSNNIVIGTALEVLVGSKVLGTYDESVRNFALSALNYVLGSNAMRKSYVTGYGEDCIKTVFNTFNGYPGRGVPRGWIPLGVNRYNGGGSSNFPAKDYLDSSDEWTTNEHSVGANCNLMFIAAYASSVEFTDVHAPVTSAVLSPSSPDGGTAWYKSGVTVSLSATDNLSGVARTEYRLDGDTDWHLYSAPVVVSTLGQHTLYYRSTDNALNSETAKFVRFTIANATVQFSLAGGGTFASTIAATYDGTAKSVQISTNPSNVPTAITYNGSTTAPRLPGTYHYVVTSADPNYGGSAEGTFEIVSPNPGRIGNLSIRTHAGTGAETLIMGFVTTSGTSSLPVLIRGIGPTLGAFGVQGTLADPNLTLFQNAAPVASNDNWDVSLADTFSQAGAFALPVGSKDAALSLVLPAGTYSTQITGANSQTGVALAEIYDRTGTYQASAPVLANISARCRAGTGSDVLTTGFVVLGDTPIKVLIRAAGPSLTQFGVADALADPKLVLFHNSDPIASNDDWDPTLSTAFTQAGAFPFVSGTKDAALLVELAPGAYTAQVQGVNDATGIALVEVYAVAIP